MPGFVYQDFYLIIDPKNQQGAYRAHVLSSGGDEAEEYFTDDEINTPASQRNKNPANAPVRAAKLILDNDTLWVANAQPPSLEEAKDFGSRLFKAVFKKNVYTSLRRNMDNARDNRAYLRLRLNLTRVPELSAKPWEFLFDDQINHFYAQSIESPLVRYIDSDERSEPVAVEGPLRILVMVVDVPELAMLNVEKEYQNLTKALEKPIASGQVEVERLNENSASELNKLLMQRRNDRPFHVFHFIGHGAYNPATHESALLVGDASGKGVRPLSAQRLSGLLRNHRDSLRLVVLNSCEGARTDDADIFVGAAPSLIRQATIPAVIAMQYRIVDRTAIEFTQYFYTALAAGYPIEGALSNGRTAIFAEGNDVEWATPVLYLNASEGQLFQPVDQVPPPPPPNIDPELNEHYKAVIRGLVDGKLVPFLGLDVNLYGRRSEKQWQPGDRLPSSRELAAHLANVFHYPAGEPLDLISVSQYASVINDGPGELYDKISEIFHRKYEVTPLHRFFARLPGILREKGYPTGDDSSSRFVIVTTTYDNLLERAFQELNDPFHVVSYVISGDQIGRFYHLKYAGSEQMSELTVITDPKQLSGTEPIILKLPGAVESVQQRFAINEDHFCDYLTYKDLSGLLPSELKGKLTASHHLYLGAGLRNWHLRGLLYRIWERRKVNRQSWAIHPEPQPTDNQFWKAAGVQLLQYDFEPYIAGLREQIEGVAPAKEKT